jgi:hypothetical protein
MIILWIISFAVIACFFIYIKISFPLNKGKTIVSISSVGITTSYNDTLKPIYETIPTTLPYNQYKKMNDSIDLVRIFETRQCQGATFSPFGGIMTMQFAMHKDVVNKRTLDLFSLKSPDKYFYILKGWKMKSEEHPFFGDYTYYVRNGVPYFRKYAIKSTDSKHVIMDMAEKKLNYFYEQKDKTILIPISKNTYNFAKYLTIFFMFVFAALSLLLFLLCLKFLYNISRGKVFILENIKMLRQASYITILTPWATLLICFSYALIFNKYFDENVVLNTDFITSVVKMLMVGLAVTILYFVFKRGFNIQQENDLVV